MLQKSYKNLRQLPLLLCVLLCLLSCSSSLSLTKHFSFYFQASNVAPDGATGDSSPTRLSYTITALTMTDSTGTTLDLWEGKDPLDVNILDRDQIVLQTDASKVEGKTFSSISITLDAAAKFSSKYMTDEDFSNPTTTLTYTGGLSCGTGSDCDLFLNVKWKNTLLRDVDGSTDSLATAPTLSFSIE